MAIQTARTYKELKVGLHKTITDLEDHGALEGPSARIVTDASVSGPDVASTDSGQESEPGPEPTEGALAEELCAMIMSKYLSTMIRWQSAPTGRPERRKAAPDCTESGPAQRRTRRQVRQL